MVAGQFRSHDGASGGGRARSGRGRLVEVGEDCGGGREEGDRRGGEEENKQERKKTT